MTPSVNGAQPVESTPPQLPESPSVPASPLQSAELTPPPTQGEGGIPISQAPSNPIGVDSVRHPQATPQDVAGISFFHQVDPTGRPTPAEAVNSGDAAIPNQSVFNEKQHAPGIAPVISAPPVPLAAAPQPITSPASSSEQPDLLQLEAPPIAIEEPKPLAPQPTEAPAATPQSPKKAEEEKAVTKTSYTSPEEAKKAGEVADWHEESKAEPEAPAIPKPEVTPKEELKKEPREDRKVSNAPQVVAIKEPPKEAIKSEPTPIKKAARPKIPPVKIVLTMPAWELESSLGADHTGIAA